MTIEEARKKIEDIRKVSKFNRKEIVKVILEANNPDFTDECIANRKELWLQKEDLVILIKRINQPDYTDKYIARRKELGFDTVEVVELIKGIGTPAYIDAYIKRRDEMGFIHWQIYQLITQITDTQYLDNYIENRDELELKKVDIKNIINKLGTISYTEKYITQKEKYGWTSKDIFDMVIHLNNDAYAKSVIDRAQEIGIEDEELEKLKLCYDDAYIDSLTSHYASEIHLPKDMTIGIEIEAIGPTEVVTGDMVKLFEKEGWSRQEETSIEPETTKNAGIEIVSPILTGDNREITKAIRRECTKLEKFGLYTNESCGGHIHIGEKYLTCTQAWLNYTEIYTNTEKMLYIMCNEKESVPRKDSIKYAPPISGNIEHEIETGNLRLASEDSTEDVKQQLIQWQKSSNPSIVNRYKAVNHGNINKPEKPTIEFRFPNGSVNPEMWVENINLLGGIVKTAEDLSKIQKKSPHDLSEEELKLLYNFHIIRGDDYQEVEKLEALMELVLPESLRSSYRQRYYSNKRTLEANPLLKEEIERKITKKAIRLSKKDIAGEVAFGENRILGEEAVKTEQIIAKMRNKNQERVRNDS